MPFDIYTWRDAMFPLVTKWFDTKVANRTDVIKQIIAVEDTKRYSFDEHGAGGFGELPAYDGNNLIELTQSKGFKKTYTTAEKAGVARIPFKAAKFDMSGEAKKAGTRMATAASMTVLMDFYRLFANGWNAAFAGGDGKPLFATDHPINDRDADAFSNTGTSTFSISAITDTQTKMRRFKTYDGLPFQCKCDLVLISPELEPKAKEFFGKEAKLIPESAENGANPVYEMKYFVIDGFSAKQWAVGDSEQMKEFIKLVYGTRPMVIDQKNPNPLIAEYIAYVDYDLGWSEPRCIFGHNPN